MAIACTILPFSDGRGTWPCNHVVYVQSEGNNESNGLQETVRSSGYFCVCHKTYYSFH